MWRLYIFTNKNTLIRDEGALQWINKPLPIHETVLTCLDRQGACVFKENLEWNFLISTSIYIKGRKKKKTVGNLKIHLRSIWPQVEIVGPHTNTTWQYGVVRCQRMHSISSRSRDILLMITPFSCFGRRRTWKVFSSPGIYLGRWHIISLQGDKVQCKPHLLFTTC